MENKHSIRRASWFRGGIQRNQGNQRVGQKKVHRWFPWILWLPFVLVVATALWQTRSGPAFRGQLLPSPTDDALSCSGAILLFPWTTPAERGDGTDTVEWWSKTYYATVDRVLTEAVNQLDDDTCGEGSSAPTPLLGDLRQKIPATVTADAGGDVLDASTQLRRYLRMYRCSLESRSLLLPQSVARDLLPPAAQDIPILSPVAGPPPPMSLFNGTFLHVLLRERMMIESEQSLAPLTLDRALFVLERAARVHGLQKQWRCTREKADMLQKTVKDAMEANACSLHSSSPQSSENSSQESLTASQSSTESSPASP